MQISDRLSVIGFFWCINIGYRYMPKTHIGTPLMLRAVFSFTVNLAHQHSEPMQQVITYIPKHLVRFLMCDWACENRASGHKLHHVTLQVISQCWNRIFAFCYLHHKADSILTRCSKLHCHNIIVQNVMSDESLKK